MAKQPFGEPRLEKNLQVGGLSWRVTPMRGRAAVRASYRFGKAVGPCLGSLVDVASAKKKSVLDSDVNFDKAVSAFFNNMPEQEFESIADELLGTVTLNGQQVDLDSVAFVGKPELALEVCFHVAKYQFEGFFSAWGSKLSAAFQGAIAQQEPSQN